MFKFKKSAKAQIIAPVTGKSVPLSDVPDTVFSDKVLGDGVAVLPEDTSVYSPCNGKIVQIAHTFHAICIETDDGVEVLLHLGIDTVKLGGEGFTCHVKTGDTVEAGQLLMEVDIEGIKTKGYSVLSPCIITNVTSVTDTEFLVGEIKHGETPIIKYEKVK